MYYWEKIMKHCFAFFSLFQRDTIASFTCVYQNVNLCCQLEIHIMVSTVFLSFHHNAQMHSSMIKFFTRFLIFQGRLSVDIAAYCAPSLCSSTHAWFHKRCTISNLAFGCSCPVHVEKLRLHILCLFAVQQFLHLQPFLVSLCY